jgi:2-haloalkanoic acid dehalogenase type II
MTPLRAVFFDLDDTLCDDEAAWVSCSMKAASIATAKIGIDTVELADAFLEISKAYWMSQEPVTERRPILEVRITQWAEALGKFTRTVDWTLAYKLGKDYGERRNTEIALFPDALATIAELREHNIRVALLTNGIRLTHAEKIAFLGLEQQFDHILIADVVGFFKPHPAIFEEALNRCSCKPDQAIMVGDHIDNDIGGAQSAGIEAYWFNPLKKELTEDMPQPKATIASLSELIGHIRHRFN